MIFGNNSARRPTTPSRPGPKTPGAKRSISAAHQRQQQQQQGGTHAASAATPRVGAQSRISQLTAEVEELQVENMQYQALVRKLQRECQTVVSELHKKFLNSERTNFMLREENTDLKHKLETMELQMQLQKERMEKHSLQNRVAELIESAGRGMRSPHAAAAASAAESSPASTGKATQEMPPDVADAMERARERKRLQQQAPEQMSSPQQDTDAHDQDEEEEADHDDHDYGEEDEHAASIVEAREMTASSGGDDGSRDASVASRHLRFESPGSPGGVDANSGNVQSHLPNEE